VLAWQGVMALVAVRFFAAGGRHSAVRVGAASAWADRMAMLALGRS